MSFPALAPEDPPSNIVVIVIDAFSLLIHWEPQLIPNGIITQEGLSPYQEEWVSISATTSGREGPLSQDVYNKTGVYNLTKQTCCKSMDGQLWEHIEVLVCFL